MKQVTREEEQAIKKSHRIHKSRGLVRSILARFSDILIQCSELYSRQRK